MIKKSIIIPLLALALAAVLMVPGAKSKTRSYYDGDAIYYNGQVIAISYNMEAFEVFRLDYNTNMLARMAKVKSFRAVYSGYDSFNSSALNIENGRLYAYLTDGTYLYKYDITNLSYPVLAKQVKDNSYDWFGAVTQVNGQMATIGYRNIKVWSNDMQVVNTFDIKTNNYASVRFSQDGRFIFVPEDKQTKVYSTKSRFYISYIAMNAADEHQRQAYGPSGKDLVYVVDDGSVKKLALNGDIQRSFKHISNLGYAVSAPNSNNSIYFSDGLGIVELSASELKPVRWLYTTGLAGGNGWAMGLKTVDTDRGNVIIVFNNSSILAVDAQMRPLASFQAYEENTGQQGVLKLTVDKNRAPEGSLVSVHGSGFASRERIEITFAKSKFSATTDENGNFVAVVTVPQVAPAVKSQPVGQDIIVDGMTSGAHYNIGFFIE